MFTMTRRQFLRGLALTPPWIACAGCGGGSSSPQAPLRAASWPEAEALFHQEPRWLGGDGVYSIDLGQGRVLWLFSDSFIATSAANTRSQSTIVRNSLAIQTGYDPATASMRFFWSETSNGPDAFFIDSNAPKWFWPAHGARIGNTLLIFLSEVQPSSGGLGFAGSGWKAVAIDNPDATPDQWQVRALDAPNQFALVVGTSVLTVGDYLYAYSHSDTQDGIFLARIPLTDAAQGTLTNLEWYTGSIGWILQSRLSVAPAALMANAQAEFNVYPNPPHTPFLEVQTDAFGAADLAYRTANAPTGPWSGLRAFYRPPEYNQSGIMIYAAKMHPMLTGSGADVVVSYSTNNTDFNTLVQDTSLYYPRFVTARWR
jgi:hypothetical protein